MLLLNCFLYAFSEFSFLVLFFVVDAYLFTCADTVWVISPLCPPSLPFPPLLPSFPGRTCSALISNFVEEKT
jgi:hypothetical protein